MDRFNKLIGHCISNGVSDLSIAGAHPLVFRKNGTIIFDRNSQWPHQEVDALAKKMLTSKEMETLQDRMSVDIARSIHNIRIRVNIFNSIRGLSFAIRLLPGTVPRLNNLNLHPSISSFCRKSSGLILVCGSTGSGKSSTMAAILEEINQIRAAHIITLEDPIEYRFTSEKSFFEQREHNTHFPSFKQGLVDVLREDPDVILVGELRDPETIRLTLNAAESGHLVIASMHATNAEDALYRIGNSFAPEIQEMVRNQLASTLYLLLVQKLKKHRNSDFRIPHLSILRGTQSVKGIIRSNKLTQIESAMQTGRDDGMFTMEKYQSEYLDNISRFTPPSENFKPSAESTNESVYQSSLFTSNDTITKTNRASQKMSQQDSPQNHGDNEINYDVDKDDSLGEVVDNIYKI